MTVLWIGAPEQLPLINSKEMKALAMQPFETHYGRGIVYGPQFSMPDCKLMLRILNAFELSILSLRDRI